MGHDKSNRTAGKTSQRRPLRWAWEERARHAFPAGEWSWAKHRAERVSSVPSSKGWVSLGELSCLWIVRIRWNCVSILPANKDLLGSLLKVQTLRPLTYWFRLRVHNTILEDTFGKIMRANLRRALNVIPSFDCIGLYFLGHQKVFLTSQFGSVLEESDHKRYSGGWL